MHQLPRSPLALKAVKALSATCTPIAFCLITLLLASTLNAQLPDVSKMSANEQADFFEQKVKPILKANCFECHGGGEKIRGELVLTNREDLIKGGESGAAIELDNPKDSILLDAINYGSYEMPPSGKLPQKEIDILTAWVSAKVPWNGEGFKPSAKSEKHEPQVNEENKKWWAYQPVKKPSIPAVIGKDWITNEIDAFILQELESQKLTPAQPASRLTLIRRVAYDLTGLPPTASEIDAFLKDNSPNAYEKLIDKYLVSPHYGEKWGRHWLDLVRYAESNSYERDGTKPFIWKYRDYVIKAFNSDKPYDQFIIEQLAGDEIANANDETLTATGYYRLGKWDDEPVSQEQAWYDDTDDILATTSQAMLGMTINCARCHDHKIDPVPQVDYYRMLSFFRNIQRYGVRSHQTVLAQSTREIGTAEQKTKHRSEVEAYEKAKRENQKALNDIEKIVKKDFIPVEHEEFRHERNRVALVKKRVGKEIKGELFTEEIADRYASLTKERNRMRREPPKALDRVLCVTEVNAKPRDTFVTVRGNAKVKGEKVVPGFPQILSPPEPVFDRKQSAKYGQTIGRREVLARWIASPTNPMTARVMVNRIWQHHFGRGIVRSSSDFGFQGTKPTHPKLLDWLADDFVQNGWKMKRLHKLMMLSSTYRMASTMNKAAYAKDPTNNLFWRFNMRRLTAEEVRDSILAANNKLNPKLLGPSIYPVLPAEVLHGQSRPGAGWNTSRGDELNRRSIYIHIKRSLPVPIMANYDVADPDTSCPVRFNTTQPSQALTMMNSDFLNKQASAFAAFVKGEVPNDIQKQVSLALSRVLQRSAKSEEIQRGLKLIKNLQSEEKLSPEQALTYFCLISLNLNEFIYLD